MIGNDKELEQYFKDARSFDYDRRISAVRWAKVAWIIAILSMITTVVSVTAVVLLTPLKTVVPFVIRVDDATGVPEVMTSLSDGQEEYDEAVSKYFLARYVRTREGYNYVGRENIFREVTLLSDFEERTEFANYYNSSNPSSPQFKYGRSKTVEIEVRSISFLNDQQAQVRYYQIIKDKDVETRTPWVSTITFSFEAKAEISDNDRLINPLGFLVTDYRADPEVIQ